MKFPITADTIYAGDYAPKPFVDEIVRRANAYDELRDAVKAAISWVEDNPDPDGESALRYFNALLKRYP